MTKKVVGAVDIGGTKILVGLVDEFGEILIQQCFMTIIGSDGAEKSMQRIISILEEQCEANQMNLSDLCGIGIVCAGPVDPKLGTVENPYTLPGWEGYKLTRKIEELTDLPVKLENDANGALMGEVLLHNFYDKRVMMINFGTGIGVAFWDAKTLYRTGGEFHPEMGHIVVSSDGPECYCNHRGCFESLCSGSALNKRALENGFKNFDHLYKESQEQNLVAAQFIDIIKHEIKNGIWNFNIIFKPDIIVLGGGFMNNYFDFVSKAIIDDAKGCNDFVADFKVFQSGQISNSALAGAAMLIINK